MVYEHYEYLSANQASPPVVLCFSGYDPTGGAGLAADIETLRFYGCHPVGVVTTLTVQDTCNVHQIFPTPVEQIRLQTEALLNDIPVAVFKIGLLGSSESLEWIAHLLQGYPHCPVVLDPILAAGGGKNLADTSLCEAMTKQLLPITTVLTPNYQEARRLAPFASTKTTLADCGKALNYLGCQWVLMTGADEADHEVENYLYHAGEEVQRWHWPKLPHCYHGSGCTLAAAIAAQLALQNSPQDAIEQAQQYTWQTLAQGYPLGKGQWLPKRYRDDRPILLN